MIQTLIVYAIVAAAAAWTGWRYFPRAWLRRRAAASVKAKAACGPGCACGD
jgi:hypothetical protein